MYCNATPDHFNKLYNQEYTPNFIDFITMIYLADNEYKAHIDDIMQIDAEEKAKNKGKKGK